jgi:hypothetical protein
MHDLPALDFDQTLDPQMRHFNIARILSACKP